MEGDRFEIDSAEIEMEEPSSRREGPPEQQDEPGGIEPEDAELEATEPPDLSAFEPRPERPQKPAPTAEADPGGAERRARRRRRETLSRVLWAIPWVIFAIVIIAAGGAVFAGAM